MKRPMLLCGCGALCASVVCSVVPRRTAAVSVFIVFFVLFVLALFGGRRRVLFLLPAFTLMLFIILSVFKEVKLVDAVGKISGEKTVCGTVCEVSGYDGAAGYVIAVDSIDDLTGNFKTRIISTLGLQLSVGDDICANVDFSGSDTISAYDLAEGIYCTGYLKELYGIRQGDAGILYRLRCGIAENITERLNYDEASVLIGITLGEKTSIPDGITEALRRSGVSHVIVVSGLHLSVLVGGIYSFLQTLKMSNRKTGVIGIVATVLLMAMTGLTVSVVRAGLTYIIMFSGLLINRRPDPMNSLFCAITLIILHDPFAAMSVSFQLSCAATFGVLLVAPRFHRISSEKMGLGIAHRTLRSFLGAVSVTLSATLMTLPFTIYHFGTFSPVTVITNLFVSLAVSAALTLTACAVVCSYVMPPVTDMILLVAGIISKFIIAVTTKIGSLSFAQITFERPEIPALTAAVLVIMFASVCFKKYDKIVKIQKERTVQLWQQ